MNVRKTDTGEWVAGGRTYTRPETNPRVMPLAAGSYDVEVKAVGLRGAVDRSFKRVQIADGQTVEKVVDFSVGELSIGVTRNGELSDATVNIYVAGTQERVGGGRTYTRSTTNPAVYRLTAGEYDVELRSVEVSGGPRKS